MHPETIIDPNQEILNIQEKFLEEVSVLLIKSKVEIIGAMAVPMAGRPELDILVISDNVEDDSSVLVKNGYKQGPIVKGTSFLKKIHEGVEIAV